VPITAHSVDPARVLSQADVACYTAKELGRNRAHVYQHEQGEPARRHGEIRRAAILRDALEQERLRLYCQPIVALAAGVDEPPRYELLVRLLDHAGTLLLPDRFIPGAERFGLIGAIDRWVIRTAFRDCQRAMSGTGVCVAINLSGDSLDDDSLPEFLRAQFREHDLPPERVCFEVAETTAIHNLARARVLMDQIRAMGSRLALDDFGSGLASLRYLRTLPVDYLKIDGSLVQGLEQSPSDQAMVRAISDLAHALGIRTVAEHACTATIVEHLRGLGVDYAQGYALGRPQPLDTLTAG
jgi:Amt family ammonium transporter